MGLWQQALPKLVWAESAAQSAQLVADGNAQAGFTAWGLLPGMARGLPHVAVDDAVPVGELVRLPEAVCVADAAAVDGAFVFHAGTRRDGDALVLEDGRLVEVVAAPEPLAEIRIGEHLLERAAHQSHPRRQCLP